MNNLDLIQTMTWAVVELHSKKPDIVTVRRALENAMQKAAALDIEKKVVQNSLMRMAMVVGTDGELTGSSRLGSF